MPAKETELLFAKIKAHAFNQLTWRDRQSKNLFISDKVLGAGERVGPPGQDHVLERPTVMVFVDEEPLSGFGHSCRYWFYDAQTAVRYRDVASLFPPFIDLAGLVAFHRPELELDGSALFRMRPPFPCPLIVPDGERYAILFSGFSWNFNLNSLEFCYRTLVDRYAFRPENIYVLHYDGTLASGMGGAIGVWPGDETAYRLQVTGQGTRAAFQSVLADLKGKLKAEDLLFIHTENEAGYDGQSYLLAVDFGKYYAADLAADLAGLPRFRSLLALMASCYSGGFRDPILANTPATNTSVACSTSATGSTAVTADGNFSKFASDWISAQTGHNPYGAPLSFNADTDGDGVIEAEEAFSYAYFLRSSIDNYASFAESSEAGGDISLAQSYRLWRWWCLLVWPSLEPYYRQLPEPEFYAILNRLTPRLRELVIPTLDRVSHEVSREVTPRLQAQLKSEFGS